ncbi:hypothetical protein [Mucilaginibacter sp. OK098]|uniref:hypothetical protein n=1 Tax=Mucilaginibacter sp. OK098 TaxID=1855297 RepID=UPI000911F643|nr:hypothetical protein [Mucilaginibacter sp. OK098]SHN37227.1 hypothetical protein SAMN05216524_1158 [Mucilaginibacter sp. OK098]
MKRNLIFSLIMGSVFLTMLSFSSITEKPIKKEVPVKSPQKFTCVADMGPVTLVSINSSSFTISWTYTGSPASFNYGGYFNNTNGSSSPLPPGNVQLPTTTLTLSRPAGSCGFRIGLACVCSDGTVVGSGHGILYTCGGGVIPF